MNVLLSGLRNDRIELNTAQAIVEAGLGLSIIDSQDSSAAEWCRSRNVPHVEHTFRHRFELRAVELYRDLLREREFDVIHCLTNRALSTALLATRHLPHPPKIVAYRGTMGHLHRLDPASRLSYLNPRVDCIVCVSDAVRRYLIKVGIPDSRLEVIWKGHDPAWYSASPRDSLSSFGIPANALAVCFLGNMRPVKGASYLLEAFDQIRPEENVHLLMIGEVREPQIAKQVGRHPHVHFLGYRPDGAKIAGACDVAVMPSVEREGLPRAILEAMAQGIPTVASDVGGLPELVVDGQCGLLVPPRDAAALRAAIRRLAQDPDFRRRLGAAARARVEGPFHFRHTAEKTLALYRRLLGSKTEA